jgi:type VI secretion system secreted protein VgrG
VKHLRVLRFASPVVGENDLLPTKIAGIERISAPFVYTIDLVAKTNGPEIDLGAVISQPASWSILQGSGSRDDPGTWIATRGVLREFAEVGHGPDWTRYRAELVSPWWPLSLTRRTKVYQHLTVPDLVRQVLVDGGIPGGDLEFNLRGRYPVRDYVLQYQEDDLAFVSRLLEHEGISWFHRHDAERSVAVLTDHPDGWVVVTGDATIPFRPRHDGDDDGQAAPDWFQQEVVDELAQLQRLVPKAVTSRDWNYRTPGHLPQATVAVGGDAVAGATSGFGAHAADAGEARRLATVRAEELRCRQSLFVGGGDQRGFRCGHRFTLESHPRSAFAQDYVLTAVEQEISQAIEHGSGSKGGTHYANRFRAQPVAQPYRPEMTTARPVVSGVLNARIDAAGAGTYADLDEQGRYHVKLMADTAESAAGSGSRPVRMAQPHTGVDHGFHLPLHRQAEVLLTHVGGDPDRPIITGTVPNPDTPSVVTGRNQTQSIWRSAGQNEIRFEDLRGSEEVFLHATRDRRVEVMHDDQTQVGNDQRLKVGANQNVQVAVACHVAIGAAYQISVGAAMNESIGASKSEEIGASKFETVAGERTLKVGKDFAVDVSGEHRETADGKRLVKAKAVLIEAAEELVLTCGKASITLKKSGDIIISGKDVQLKASGKLAGKAGGDVILKGSKTGAN